MSRFGIQPSVPVSVADPVDWAHLSRATFDDCRLGNEVLGLFVSQATELAAALRELPPDALTLAHKLKGSARGIGAWRVADAVETLEAAFATSADPRPAFDALLVQLADARVAIETRLRAA